MLARNDRLKWMLSWLPVDHEETTVDHPARTTASDAEVLQFMRGVMDEFTHLGRFPTPVDPELVIVLAAEMDAYVPRQGVTSLVDLWPGVELRFIRNQGHVAAIIFQQGMFRQAIVDSLERNSRKYYNTGL